MARESSVTPLWRIGNFFRERQRWVLVALLGVLHLTLLAGGTSAVGLMCWLVDVGLFMLWQPFVHGERRLDAGSLSLLALVLAAGGWLFGWWLLILWVSLLIALLGGRVMTLAHRPTRLFYLLAFAYLLGALLVWLVPKVVPETGQIGPSLDRSFAALAPLLIAVMVLMPTPREVRVVGGEKVDFFYSLFVFLLTAVLVLGSLAFMLLREALYIEAVFKTLVSMALILLFIAWVWSPRLGSSGLGVFLSRYLLTIGLPFESWLQRLVECSELESDPDRFLALACERLLDLPWVTGGRWALRGGVLERVGEFGETSRYRQEFPQPSMVLTFYTRHKLSPSLVWHFHLLAQLTNEYYVTKQRARELEQMSYLRAVHETGARLTHDVKNLLQSLNNLCFMAQLPQEANSDTVNLLLQRQLPQITQRLQQTLEKLQAPVVDASASSLPVPAAAWWSGVRQRYNQAFIHFDAVALDDVFLPATLFDSVLDNLLHNAILKQQSEEALLVRVSLDADGATLCVSDNGSAIDRGLADDLMRAPVRSENGLGIGLYHAAQQAEGFGYRLRLTDNVPGRVCFMLSRLPPKPGAASAALKERS